ncbi:hypothetical protein BDP27DRAFT_1235911 [Rhodocollybia butyracea]|uniref:Uncharacterized protein n=1 Tax=Rhodocollybia butyracea TaxID=206335 RepID=A0A9P5TYY3_9AGAR|nr:hypothetical protein BDP27DRAFT_1235911 [Rhodocollybia butyracea]
MSGNPHTHEINHPLKILVDQLLDFWEGVFYTCTADHPLGRNVLLALILVVCDTEAAHQVSGFGSHSATYFCRRCKLMKSQIGQNFDPEAWPRRDLEEHRAQALRWLNASSEAEHQSFFETSSIRYTELLRLPYFNPITMTTFDDMHMGLLGLIDTHISDVMQVDHSNNGGEGQPVISGKRPSNLHHPSPLTAPWMKTPQKILGKDVLKEIAKDMKQTILPSWMSPAPHPSLWARQGGEKLSAEEWKVAGTIHVPITLISIWGYHYEKEPQSQFFQILLNYLHMVHALCILFLRETSAPLRVEYRTRILDYLHSLRKLFPDFSIKPNQHYSVHAVEDLENLGPGHARSTPVWERDNGDLQEMNSNRRRGTKLISNFHSVTKYTVVGELEVTRMKTYCRQGNLKLVLDNITDPVLLEDFGEAIDALQAMELEDHRGMFSGTDLSAWTSPDRDFKKTPTVILL